MEICPLEADLFYADGRTGRYDAANSRSSQFAKAPKKILI